MLRVSGPQAGPTVGTARSSVDAQPRVAPVKVLYIAGLQRSGSTLVANAMATHTGFFSAGEVALIWKQFATSGVCGCAAAVDKCPTWRDVPRTPVGRPGPGALRLVDR